MLQLTQSDVPEALQQFFADHPRIALAYSGGCDSVYLLACAVACGVDVAPYLVHSAFQYDFEPADATDAAQQIGVDFKRITVDVFDHPQVIANEEKRCYHCKHVIFSTILERAAQDGFSELMDGTNASDDPNRRPGFQALYELEVFSPLRLAGLTKDEIRARSRKAGLVTADKPNYSCLATRVPTGTPITPERLASFSQDDWKERSSATA